MSWETWKTGFEVGSIIAVGVTLVCAIGAWYASQQVNEAQKIELRNFSLALAAQQERAALAETSLLELKERMKDRQLNQEQQTRLVNLLSVGPRCKVAIITGVNDDEATRFQQIVLGILHKAGWDAEPFTIAQTSIASGIGLANRNADQSEPCTANLWNALDSIGMRPEIWKGGSQDTPLEILIGPKPQPPN